MWMIYCSDRSPLNNIKSVVVEVCHLPLNWPLLYVCIFVYVCTDMGTVLKVVTIPRETWHDLEEVVLEEMTVFMVCSSTTAQLHFLNLHYSK